MKRMTFAIILIEIFFVWFPLTASSDERVCQWSDVGSDWCRKGDILLVTAPPSKIQLSESVESILVAASVAKSCDLAKTVVRVSKVAVVCYYLGGSRDNRRQG